MAHSPAHAASSLPEPYQCSVCRKMYVHLFDHVCIVKDACCHFGEMLISEPIPSAPRRAHVKPPASTPPAAG